jgi:hypothetical protein
MSCLCDGIGGRDESWVGDGNGGGGSLGEDESKCLGGRRFLLGLRRGPGGGEGLGDTIRIRG